MKARRLNNKEITYILSKFDVIEYFGVANAKLLRDGYKNETRKKLEQLILVPNAIIDYGTELIQKYIDARIPGGVMLGSICAEALTRDLTQDALDGKKNTGTSKHKITYLDKFKDIASFRPTDKAKEVTSVVYFKKGLNNFSSTVSAETKIKQLTLKTLAMSIVGPEDPKLYFDPERYGEVNKKDWYDLYFKTWDVSDYVKDNIEKTEWFVRIKIKTNILYKYKISLGEVCNILKGSKNYLFECIPSPMFLEGYAYLDIYPIKEEVQKATSKSKTQKLDSKTDLLTKIFLTNVFMEELDNYVIVGIKNIYGYSVNWIDSIFGLGVSTQVPETKGVWRYWFNFGWLYNNNLDENFYINIFKYLKLKYKYDVNDSFAIVYTKENPTEILSKHFTNLNKAQIDESAAKAKEKKRLLSQGEIYKADKVSYVPTGFSNLENSLFRSFYISLDGTNLAHLFMLKEIDTNRTFSNDLHETYQFFGIDMVRDLIVKRLSDIFDKANIWIEPNFFTLFADYLCFYGKPIKIGHYGAIERGDDPMITATLKKPDDILSKAALFGSTSSPHTSTGVTMTGQVSRLGLPIVREEKKTTMEKEIESQLDDNIDLDTDTVINMINSFQNIDKSIIDDEEDTSIIFDDNENIKSVESDSETVTLEIDEPPSQLFDPSVLGSTLITDPITFSQCPIDFKEYEYILQTEDGEIIEEEIINIED